MLMGKMQNRIQPMRSHINQRKTQENYRQIVSVGLVYLSRNFQCLWFLSLAPPAFQMSFFLSTCCDAMKWKKKSTLKTWIIFFRFHLVKNKKVNKQLKIWNSCVEIIFFIIHCFPVYGFKNFNVFLKLVHWIVVI